MKKALLVALSALCVTAVACGSGDNKATDDAGNIAGRPPPAAPISGTIVVSAATSLTKAFEEIARQFKIAKPNVDVQLNFGASSTLAEQIIGGAKADVFASADETTMDRLAQADLVDESARFATNELTIITKPANPSMVKSLGDLSSAGIISLCGDEVPCGRYATEALDNAGVTIAESQITRGQNAAATLSAVADGDAVAGIVYVTDAQSNTKVATVAIPAAQNVEAAYPVAALASSQNLSAAQSFIAFVRGAVGQQVLRSFGFGPGA